MSHFPSPFKKLLVTLLAPALLALPGCYSYRLATKAQYSTDDLATSKVNTASLFWGLVNKPQVIQTPNCDAMDVLGVAEVQVRTNFGFVLLTVATLGISCPMTISWKCSKPCIQSDSL